MQWHSGNFWTPSEPTVRFGFLCKLTDGEAQRKMCLGVTELGDDVHLGGNDKHKPVIKSKINVENNGLATHCRGDKYSCTFPQMHACLPVCDSHVKPEHDDDIYQSSVRATNVWFVIYVQAEAAAVCVHRLQLCHNASIISICFDRKGHQVGLTERLLKGAGGRCLFNSRFQSHFICMPLSHAPYFRACGCSCQQDVLGEQCLSQRRCLLEAWRQDEKSNHLFDRNLGTNFDMLDPLTAKRQVVPLADGGRWLFSWPLKFESNLLMCLFFDSINLITIRILCSCETDINMFHLCSGKTNELLVQ